jgi:Uma2 family endonuclease
MATAPIYPLLTADEFLDFDFGDRKAELDNGVIRMMAGGAARHAEVQGNVFAWLHRNLRGSGCRPYGPDMATRTNDLSIRYPDVSVFCHGRDDRGQEKSFDDPRVLIEVLSAGTARTDLRVKLEEYRALDSVDTILFIDIALERVRVVQRTAAHGWSDVAHDAAFDVPFRSLGLTIPRDFRARLIGGAAPSRYRLHDVVRPRLLPAADRENRIGAAGRYRWRRARRLASGGRR